MIDLPDKSLLKKENSFDFIRYYLSLVVLVAHFAGLTGSKYYGITYSYEAVRGFFILSGFLVFHSYTSKPILKDYIIKRIKRIFPAYYFIIIFCVIIGIFLTNLLPISYLTSGQLYKYLLANLSYLNFLEPSLPGVFTDNPMSVVNGSLWTMKVELLLYITVPISYYFLRKYNKEMVMACIFLFSILYNKLFLHLYNHHENELFLILKRQVGGQLLYFYAGTFILIYFNYFQKYIRFIFPIALILYIFKNSLTELFPFFQYLQAFAFASIIIGFAYNFKYLNFLRKYDNIAYGLYLFHFPVIQIIVHYKIHEYNYYLALFLALLFTVLIALFSWHFIEKPILKYRKR